MLRKRFKHRSMAATFARTMSRSTMSDPSHESALRLAADDLQVLVAAGHVGNEVDTPVPIVVGDQAPALENLVGENGRGPSRSTTSTGFSAARSIGTRLQEVERARPRVEEHQSRAGACGS